MIWQYHSHSSLKSSLPVFEEPEDPSNRSFFSEIISSISDVRFSHSGRYLISRDYLSVKVWDVLMDTKPVETFPVHEYLRSKLCSLYENDCIFDKFECVWNGTDRWVETGELNWIHTRTLVFLYRFSISCSIYIQTLTPLLAIKRSCRAFQMTNRILCHERETALEVEFFSTHGAILLLR